MLEIHQFACLSDNYGFLVHDEASGETACIDTPDAEAYLREAAAKGWRITQIWNTHWHPDHAGGNAAIVAATGATVVGPAEVERLGAAPDRVVTNGDAILFGRDVFQVVDVGGHTLGHVAYHDPRSELAFVGDSLFALGCGRMFEGSPEQFWRSLVRIRELPTFTTMYCAHEYTESNLRFALHADPENEPLQIYGEEIRRKRAAGEPTVPFPLQRERDTNPFLRADDPALQARWGGGGDAVATFAALRAAKDSF